MSIAAAAKLLEAPGQPVRFRRDADSFCPPCQTAIGESDAATDASQAVDSALDQSSLRQLREPSLRGVEPAESGRRVEPDLFEVWQDEITNGGEHDLLRRLPSR